MKLTKHLHLVPRSRIVELYLHPPTYLQGIMLNYLRIKDNQNYWVLGLCPSSSILKSREHKVSETGSLSVHR
jgi:hypothetical protein